ncbi:phenylalanine 4-monooxygenase [Peijinzhouia sedimentorum]
MLQQIYDNYTKEDQQVWNILFNRQLEKLHNTASETFIQGLKDVKFTPDHIPHFGETNELLAKSTGWEIVAVPGLIDDDIFFELLAQKKFPATTWLRKMEQLDYLEEPDMFHDVYAHVPLLSNQPFVDFLQKLAIVASQHSGDDKAIHLLSRVYWYTVEFGLIRENGNLRIYGAGILSSSGETHFSLSDKPKRSAYDLREVLRATYYKHDFQTQYFVIESYEELYESLKNLDEILVEELNLQEAL